MNGQLAGFFAPWVIFAGILGLHVVLPARRVAGYARDEHSGELLRYRLNGLLVFAVSIGIWVAAGYTGAMPWDWLWQHRWSGAAGALTLGLLVSAAVVLTAPGRGGNLLADLYLGRRANPQMFNGRADAKMFLYLALFSWFVCDYLGFEHVHLYTYDLFAERLGFKLVWGCLSWYPYFYAVSLWSVADLPNPQTPVWLLILAALVFFAAWSLSRGANMQKFCFKRNPEGVFLGLAPKAFSDGERNVLYSGFWGVSRHVNYLGEIVMATGLALALGWPLMLGPWLYPLYYVALLLPREREDDRRCAEKYGPLWEQYREKVPWRIVPRAY